MQGRTVSLMASPRPPQARGNAAFAAAGFSVENSTAPFEQSCGIKQNQAKLEEEHHSSRPQGTMNFVGRIVRVCPGG